MKQPAPRTEKVPEELHGERVDKALAALFDLSRRRARELLQQGAVFLGRRRVVRLSQAVQSGELLRADPGFQPPRVAPLAPRVLYLDEAVLALDKPAGMPTSPTLSGAAGTLLYEAHRQRLASFRPLEVHRLDAPTSGVVLAAREGPAQRGLSEQFQRGAVEKRYLCRVHGAPAWDEFLVDTPLAPDPRRPHRWRVALGPGARSAETHLRVLVRGGDYSDLEVRPRTGRTHQIRVHLQSQGLPIFGDHDYGDRERDDARGVARLWLHAAGLRCQHPMSGAPLLLEAPLPADMAGFGEVARG